MVFSNTVFLFLFLPAVIILYNIIPTLTAKNVLLTIASLIFYAYGEPFTVFLMIGSVLVNYFFGLLMSERFRLRKLFLGLSVTANILILVIFKYSGFLVDIINGILPFSISKPDISLPIGISFFTFQAMSYVIDVYREPEIREKNPAKLLLYISFFPQLIAGPIIKYHDVKNMINGRTTDPQMIAEGIRRFILGLSKKVIIANQMAIAADSIYALDDSSLTAPAAWLGAICYMFQIYFDFSGYSDMAIGLGKMFGFTFKENFDHPYVSSSMTEFWRRWHISLSTWFKEYLYIPLGGNRKGTARTYINKMTVFLLTGLWHGASVNFIIWGALNGGALLFETKTGLFKNGKQIVIGHIYTVIFTALAFVVFRAESFSQSLSFYKAMFTGFSIDHAALANVVKLITPVFIMVFIMAVIFSAPVRDKIKNVLSNRIGETAVDVSGYVISIAMLLICILSLSSATYNPFIYFRF